MQKVLIISASFFGYQDSVANAFSDLGYDVLVEIYDEPIHPFRGLLKWQHKFARNKEKLRMKSKKKYAAYITKIFDTYKPDIVFSFNGTILLDNTLDYFRKKAKVIFWMYDSVQRSDRAACKEHINHADAVFCFEKDDVDYYANMGKKAYFLPLACDTHVYYPIENSSRNIDILFVGNVYGSKKRKHILHLLVNHYSGKKILIYGSYKPYYKNPIKWLFREKRNIFKNKNIPPKEVNILYSQSKIALNIHHEQTIYGANQRVFESSGAGVYQVCDANPYIESIFPNGEVGLYHNEKELISLIDNALRNDQSENAKKAHEIVYHQHTFQHRVREMLNIIQNNNELQYVQSYHLHLQS